MAVQNLSDLLSRAAAQHTGQNAAITIYGSNSEKSLELSYRSLQSLSTRRAAQLERNLGKLNDKIVLIYFQDHLNSLIWFWAIVLAGGVPCICPTQVGAPEYHASFLQHLQTLLENPPMITTKALASQLPKVKDLLISTAEDIEAIESVNSHIVSDSPSLECYSKNEQDLAVLMLTSGSTGNPKAVCLKHGQLLQSIESKSAHHNTTEADIFLNWIGLDHVANLVEIHLHAISLGASQIHIQSSTTLADPLFYLDKISLHKVTYTFAPNFFLAMLVQALSGPLERQARQDNERHSSSLSNGGTNGAVREHESASLGLDLSSIRALISGGESNVVDTCETLSHLFKQYGARGSFIRPGFGMTETCAGSIYNAQDCPSYDISQGTDFCSVGDCIRGMQMRISRPDGADCGVNEMGSLEVSGPIVFSGYYRDDKATREAFTDKGWFKTGDLGLLDSNGRLRLTGREKDTVLINGVNHASQAIEAAVEEANISEITPSYTVAFAYRPKNSVTECLCIVFLPSAAHDRIEGRLQAAIEISKAVVKFCGARPSRVLALPEVLLQKSSLGKLSRSRIRRAFENGEYNEYEIRQLGLQQPSSPDSFDHKGTHTQKVIVHHIAALLGVSAGSLALTNDLLGLGISSIDVLQLRAGLQEDLHVEIPITMFFTSSSIQVLGDSIDALHKKKQYNPINTLQPAGSKTPLFIIHPGMGDVLIFMNLARYITDRPFHAIRARGFDGEELFSSMEEMVTTYHAAIKRVQPEGPYAIAGYLFGSIVAFELTKLFEANGDTVQFLAIIDQPPHLKQRAAMYDWYQTVVTISFFMGLITEDYAYASLPDMRQKTHEEVLDHIFGLADPTLVEQIGMTRERLRNWADLAYQVKVIAREYDPAGIVAKMHVMYTKPRATASGVQSEEQYFIDHVSKWNDFARDVTFHKVEGKHTNSIAPPNVFGFQKLLKALMSEDGL